MHACKHPSSEKQKQNSKPRHVPIQRWALFSQKCPKQRQKRTLRKILNFKKQLKITFKLVPMHILMSGSNKNPKKRKQLNNILVTAFV
jgi:hypothetical protein